MSTRESQRLLGERRIFTEPPDSTTLIEKRDISHKSFKNLSDRDRLELRLTRRFLLEIFETKNLPEISNIGKDQESKDQARHSFVEKYCTMLGFNGSYEEKVSLITGCLGEANSAMLVLEDPQIGLLRQLRGNIGTLNEVSIVNDPIDLILMSFSTKASRRMRYEARRKLLLGDLAARSKLENMDIEKRLDKFSRFLGQNIWSGKTSAEIQHIELLSFHSPENYACTNIKILEPEEKVGISEFIQYHRFGMRSWNNIKGHEKHVMVEHRGKSDAAQIIKLLRKDTKNIGSIDDVAGFKMTFITKNDIYDFLEKLQYEANKLGTSLIYEEVYDTIDNGDDFRVTNSGSSSNLEIIKVHLNFNGNLIELQLHTIRSFIDSRLHDEYGFEEYALSRIFQKGKYDESVVDLLYPKDIYGSEISLYFEELKADVRESKRVRSHFLPIERSLKKLKIIRYSDSDLVTDSSRIISQLTEIPDLIVAIGKSGLPLAREIAMHFPGTRIIIHDPQNTGVIEKFNDNVKNILIVDDMGDQCANIIKSKKEFPNSKVAVLGKRTNKTSETIVDYFGRIVEKDEFLSFTWDRGIKEQEGQVFTLGFIWRLTDGKIEILLEKTDDGRYKLPGGRVENEDADIDEAFYREINEEVGIQDRGAKRLIDVTYESKRNLIYPKSFVRFYEIEMNDLPEFNKERDLEVAALIWVEASSASELLSTPEFKKPFIEAMELFKLKFKN
jgi:8-oxo-dGTP pyrophosphatase MutT (NUDIX family)/hypoxanthine phosphoribosyltransferase